MGGWGVTGQATLGGSRSQAMTYQGIYGTATSAQFVVHVAGCIGYSYPCIAESAAQIFNFFVFHYFTVDDFNSLYLCIVTFSTVEKILMHFYILSIFPLYSSTCPANF